MRSNKSTHPSHLSSLESSPLDSRTLQGRQSRGMPYLNIGHARIATDRRKVAYCKMSRSAFMQQVGNKASTSHPNIVALQSTHSSQIFSLRCPLLGAMVAGYTNLKDSESLQDTMPVTHWKRKSLHQTYRFNIFSSISHPLSSLAGPEMEKTKDRCRCTIR